MAVPKKRRSKAKGRTRLAIWKGKGRKAADRALTLAKSVFNTNSKFIFDAKIKRSEKEDSKEQLDTNNTKSVEGQE